MTTKIVPLATFVQLGNAVLVKEDSNTPLLMKFDWLKVAAPFVWNEYKAFT